MPLFRRERLHERMARLGGIDAEATPAQPVQVAPRWGETAPAHGIHRHREWDAIITVEAPELRGDELQFVVLEDGTILEEDNPTEQDLSVLADAVEMACGRPYRARAVRRRESTWAVGARRIRVTEIPEMDVGDDVTLTVRDGVREVVVDHGRWFGSVPSLEDLGGNGPEAYVIEATRLDGNLFEYRLTPL